MRAMALTLAASSLLSNALVSQRPMRQAQGAGQGAAPNAGPMQGEGRAQLEGRVRREFARVVRNRVGLSDEQMQKLGPLTQRLEEQRRSLQMDERDARVALQGIILGDTPSDSAKVEQLLDNLLDVQRKRLQLAESEQNLGPPRERRRAPRRERLCRCLHCQIDFLSARKIHLVGLLAYRGVEDGTRSARCARHRLPADPVVDRLHVAQLLPRSANAAICSACSS